MIHYDFRFFILLNSILLLWGCQSKKPIIHKVAKQHMPQEALTMNLPLSTISFSYQISKQAINEQLNSYLDSIFNESWSFPEQEATVHITRMKSSSITLQDKRILTKLPLHIDIDKNTLLGTWSVYGELLLTILSEIDINDQWALSCDTDILDYEWTQPPQIKLGFLDIPIERLTKGLTEHIKPLLEKNIDQSLKEHFDLAEHIATAVTPLLTPYQLDSTVGGWISMSADSIHMTPWTNEESMVSGKIYAPFTTQVTSSKPITPESLKLPPFTWNDKIGDISNINLGIELNYTYLTDLAQQQFLNKSFKNGKRVVKITDLTIYGGDQRLGVIASTTGSFNGSIQLEGRPIYRDGTLYCEDIIWDLTTKNILHKTGVWLKKGFIHDQLNEMLTFDLNPYVIRAQGEIHDMLRGIKNETLTDISINWGPYDITDLNCQKQELSGIMSIDLQIDLIINELTRLMSE